jgi:hypothetical protein
MGVLVDGQAVEQFLRDAMFMLGEHERAGGTALGFGPVLKRLAEDYGLPVAMIQVPRLNRAEQEAASWRRLQKMGSH